MRKKNYIEGIKIGKYTLKSKPIGSGAYGTVYLAKSDDNVFLAAKRLDISTIEEHPKIFNAFVTEVKMYHKLCNEHIIKLFDVKRTRTHVYLFLEYCDCETLESFSKNYFSLFNHYIPSSLLQFLVRQIVDGVTYMAQKNCMHRDLKLENIMISQGIDITVKRQFHTLLNSKKESFLDNLSLCASLPAFNCLSELDSNPLQYYGAYAMDESKFIELVKESTIKIIDLGFARELNDEGRANSFYGSPYQIAPEVWALMFKQNSKKKDFYSYKADLWSLGSCIYQLAFLDFPFKETTREKIYKKVQSGGYVIKNNKSNVTLELVDLINGLMRVDPDARYDYQTLLNHPFIVKQAGDLTPFDWLAQKSNEIILNANDSTLTFIKQESVLIKDKLDEEEEKRKIKEREREEELEKYIDYQFYDENCSLIEYETFIEEWEDWVVVSINSTK